MQLFSLLHTVPSAPVQSLSGVNSSSTSLTISWQPPPADDQNGIIRAYNVSYGLPEETSSYTNESTPNEMIELTGLEKFTEYLVIVNAFTVGPGPSASVTVRTDSDRELPYDSNFLMHVHININVCLYTIVAFSIVLFIFFPPPFNYMYTQFHRSP